jgi:hypothetical protein
MRASLFGFRAEWAVHRSQLQFNECPLVSDLIAHNEKDPSARSRAMVKMAEIFGEYGDGLVEPEANENVSRRF